MVATIYLPEYNRSDLEEGFKSKRVSKMCIYCQLLFKSSLLSWIILGWFYEMCWLATPKRYAEVDGKFCNSICQCINILLILLYYYYIAAVS